ncbi:unnamed protein product [Paramecium primaurelia]|uniref:Uncharacterized protein n=1 Tax=Paramecium primaurelia TaxID=5886 RepID=A0A8S1LH18_PARPR|nr:unnamed protein product [Paramecium primaurelia]
MIKKTFSGISLRDKQKFTFKEQNGLLCYTFTQIVLIGKGEAKIYGLSNNKKIQIASLNEKQNQCKCKFIMDENNFTHLLCIGDESITINVLGYRLENQVQELQENNYHENLIIKEQSKVLKQKEVDSNEFELFSKKEKKEYKKIQNQKQLLQKY